MSTDNRQVQKYIDDEFCDIKITNGFYKDFMHGMKEISRLEKSLSVSAPCLFISGEDDPVGNLGKSVSAICHNYKKTSNAELKLFPHMSHEIINEKENKNVYENILIWLISTHSLYLF